MSRQTNDLARSTPPEAEDSARLRWTDPSGQAQECAIDVALSIGRHADNLLTLPDPQRQISRRHALIERTTSGDYTLTDLGSANGTFVNDRALTAHEPVPLRDGDRVGIGPMVLTFTAPTPPVDLFAHADAPPDVTVTLNLPRPIVGWLELPDGKRRLLEAETRIGRTSQNDIALDDDSQVSRRHATIRHLESVYILSDLGSANGVRVNGEPVLTPRELRDNDRIEIGNSTLRFILAPLSETPGESGFVSQGELDLALGSRTSVFDLLGESGAAPQGNLREVTTLFADMRGSTALSERLNNPEQTTVIVNRIFDALTAEIVRYDGWVVKFAGDNIMAIFGAPRAHEDDPERCVKAALAMLGALEKFNRQLRRQLGLAIQMRVGIASGQVVYGEVGGGDFRRLDVMGPSVNLASRLEHASRVGHITVSEAVHSRARRAFVFNPLPPQELKGIRGPVQAYEVVRERGSTEVLQESVANDYLIGREAELAQLRAIRAEVRAGQGRLLAIVGDAGIGKSQLLAAFRRAEVAPEGQAADAGQRRMSDHDWITARAISYESSASYALLGNVIQALLRLDGRESIDRAALAAALTAALPDLDETTHAK
jgi:class 3 adenylate cyclase/pSer/pThr/pTyr-binding forkhead associated (FHA) protein